MIDSTKIYNEKYKMIQYKNIKWLTLSNSGKTRSITLNRKYIHQLMWLCVRIQTEILQ